MRIAYLVHNLTDAAVARRIAMLRAAGAEVRLFGFCRDESAPATVADVPARSLGRSHDAALGQRVRLVLANLPRPLAWRRALAGCDVIVARNLEMLLLGVVAARFGGVKRVVYECLDIHRSLLGSGPASRALRWLERALVRRSRLLVHSSPAFWAQYFQAVQHLRIDQLLVENKVLDLSPEGPRPGRAGPPPGPPWTIGWFGNLRCRRSLARLRALAEGSGGALRVLIAGKPSPAEFTDFAADIDHPAITYAGPYTAADLPRLYGACHFAWSIDYFEEGLNSTWLLPNRIYEAAAHGVVPIALDCVETGHWLARHQAGLRIPADLDDAALAAVLLGIDPAGYAGLRTQVAAIPDSAVFATRTDCCVLAERIGGQ